jgi:hypothetical protein
MRTYAELPALMTLMTGDEKHGPSATSTLDVLWVLYDQVLRVSADRVDDPGRDRFLLSKGHGLPGFDLESPPPITTPTPNQSFAYVFPSDVISAEDVAYAGGAGFGSGRRTTS